MGERRRRRRRRIRVGVRHSLLYRFIHSVCY